MTRTLKGQTEEVEKRGKERLEDEIRRHEREVRDLRDREGSERNSLERRIEEGEREVRKLKGDIENLRSDLEREQTINRQLKVPHLTSPQTPFLCQMLTVSQPSQNNPPQA